MNTIEERESCLWQIDDEEILRIQENINLNDILFKIENGIVRTKAGKIWIPETRRQEMIRKTHNMLSHAEVLKVLNYMSTKMSDMVNEVIRMCEACQKTKVYTRKTKEKTVQITVVNHSRKWILRFEAPKEIHVLAYVFST